MLEGWAAMAPGGIVRPSRAIGSPARQRQHARRGWRACCLCLVAALLVATVPRTATTAMTAPSAWTPTGSMTTPRAAHTATLLPGGMVLVAGGCKVFPCQYGPLASAELYDPATGTWRATGSMVTARYGDTATRLPSGQVLFAGGCPDYYCSNALSSAELYDPATGVFTLTGSMTSAREGQTAVLLRNGTVLVAGGATGQYGQNLASAEIYNPATGTWQPTGSMSTARLGQAMVLLPDGKVLVAGGVAQLLGIFALASAEVYDPGTGTWSATGKLRAARSVPSMMLLPTGKVLVAGGEYCCPDGLPGSRASAELYDPATGAWSFTGAMASGRVANVAVLLANGQALVAGGTTSQIFGTPVLASAEMYLPHAGVWIPAGTMTAPRMNDAAVVLNNGRVLVMGGIDACTAQGVCTDLASAELYTP